MENNQLVNQLATFESDFLFFQSQIDSLRKDFLNKFIAIYHQKIIDSAPSIEELEQKLAKKHIDISKIVVEFVPEEETIMVL